MTRPQPGTLGWGQVARDPIVELSRDVRDLRSDLEALQAAMAQSSVVVPFYSASSGFSFPNGITWNTYAAKSVTVPYGCTRMTYFLYAQTGMTLATTTSTANAGVDVGFGTASNALASDGVSKSIQVTGVGGPTTADGYSYQSSNASGAGYWSAVTPGATIWFGVLAYVTGASNANSGNASINGVITFTRS